LLFALVSLLATTCRQYVLLHHRGDHQPGVNPDVGTQNYEEPNRDDFDMAHVETVLTVLGNIDGLEMRPNR